MSAMAGLAEAAAFFIVLLFLGYLALVGGLLLYGWLRLSLAATVTATFLALPPAALTGSLVFIPVQTDPVDPDVEIWGRKERAVGILSLGLLGAASSSVIALRITRRWTRKESKPNEAGPVL